MKTKWPIHDQDEIEAVAEILNSGKTNYWTGEQGQKFESEFAEFVKANYALTVTNGTTALELALHAVTKHKRRSEYDEVIVPCRTFMATASAVATSGLTPVLADIDSKTLNVTVDTLEARRTPMTVGVIVVHYAGLPCDMDSIMKWARKHKLFVIEDCAHAHGARYKGMHVGTFGDIGCFSFCVGKIMSLGGEGGMVVTNAEYLANVMAARRDHGRYQMVGSRTPGDTVVKDMTQFQWTVEEFGTNLRMTEMQSVIGRLQLKKLDRWVEKRRYIANRYRADIEPRNKFRHHPVSKSYYHSYYMYLCQVEASKRDEYLRTLNNLGIPARLGGCHNIGYETVFQKLGRMACPVADAVGARMISLPVYPTMTEKDILEVIKTVEKVIKS